MRKFLIISLIGFCSVAIYGQDLQNRHEFSVWGAGGISNLQYDPAMGNHSVGLGGFGGLGYNYFLNYNWSLGIGAEYSILNAKTKFDLFSDSYRALDATAQYLYQIDVEGQNYEQKHTAKYINIPIMAKYQTDDIWKGKMLYAAGGVKLGIPVDGSYKSKGTFTTKGWELEADGTHHTNDPYTDMPHHGFGTYSHNQKADIDFKMNVMLSVEAGMKWKLKSNNKWFLYTGLFFDYGLSNIRKSTSRERDFTSFYQYNPKTPAQYTVNSLMDANYNNASQSFVNKVNTTAFGVKVQLTFGSKPFHSKKEKVQKLVEEKAFEGLTAAQMEDIMNRGTNKLIDAQHKEFEALKALLAKEEPDFTGCVSGFDLNKSEILPFMYAELDRKVEVMRKYPNLNVRLVGHTDDLGTDDLNQRLGMDRAQSVKAYMVAKGISPSRLETASKGKHEPYISNTDDGRRRSNRRVDIILIK